MPFRQMRPRRLPIADRYKLGFSFAAINTWETVLVPKTGHHLGLVYLIAYAEVNNESISLRDSSGNGNIAVVELSRGESAPLIQASAVLPIDGSLQAQVTSLDVSLSVWAVDIRN